VEWYQTTEDWCNITLAIPAEGDPSPVKSRQLIQARGSYSRQVSRTG